MEQEYNNGKKLLCGNYSQYTPTGKDYFVRAGRWHSTPRIGDIVYFYSDSLKRVCHVGIVIEVKNTGDIFNIKTIEGNTSGGSSFNRNGGCVAEKDYTFKLNKMDRHAHINGFGRPDFNDNTCSVEEFIQVAKGEVGYLEKNSDMLLNDKVANAGSNNFTKYGKWYGQNGVYWCQQFVSWCAYMACIKHLENSKTGWIKDGSAWKYKENGLYVQGQWKYIDSRWYVFDKAGCMIKGWFSSGNDWYYINENDGTLASSQWISKDDDYYYLTSSGVMARYCYIYDKEKDIYYWVDEEGKYISKWDTKSPNLSKYELVG